PYTDKDSTHSMPFSMLEAFKFGVPVICSENVAGASELLLMESIEVFNFDSDDFNKITEHVLENKNKLTYNALRFLEKYCNQKSYIKRYMNLYQIAGSQLPALSLKIWRSECQRSSQLLVKGIENMKRYYENKKVTVEYSRQRFSKYPYNIINQSEQTEVSKSIKKFITPFKNKIIIDLSSGDGRMLNALVETGKIFAFDNSAEMHNISRELNCSIENKIIRIISDSFNIPLKNNSVDAVVCFRFLRHFEYKLRKSVYSALHKILKLNGIFIFDASSKNLECSIRYNSGWGGYNIYDVFFSNYTLAAEMYMNNFMIMDCHPVGIGLFSNIQEPISWVVTVKKNDVIRSTIFFDSVFK
ncbi:methyltransferase domain-containing protein, partial [Candidatus Dependentiae bacterium]|nr:methyltransferase domain-containing protein [Candidatus Dependentiae bacterium]